MVAIQHAQVARDDRWPVTTLTTPTRRAGRGEREVRQRPNPLPLFRVGQYRRGHHLLRQRRQ